MQFVCGDFVPRLALKSNLYENTFMSVLPSWVVLTGKMAIPPPAELSDSINSKLLWYLGVPVGKEGKKRTGKR